LIDPLEIARLTRVDLADLVDLAFAYYYPDPLSLPQYLPLELTGDSATKMKKSTGLVDDLIDL
jgi:hypothetical protein